MIISVTDLSSYEYCPRKLFLKKILKIVEVPKESMILGSIRHEAFESIGKNEEHVVKGIKEKLDYPGILQRYKESCSTALTNSIIKYKSDLQKFNLDLTDTFKNAWDSIFLEGKNRAFNLHKFQKKTGLTGDKLWKELTPKIEAEVRVSSEELHIKGIIDKIERYPDRLIPYELKTGQMPRDGVWPGHQLQMGAYIMLLNADGNNITEGFIEYLDHEETRTVPFNEFLETKITKLRDEIIKMLGQKELPQRIDNMKKCNACAFKEQCYNDKFMNERMQEVFN